MGRALQLKRCARHFASAYDHGVNFFDTADGYQDGESEKAVGAFVREHPDVHFTTKIGHKETPYSIEHFNAEHLRKYVDDSLKNMGVDAWIVCCYTARQPMLIMIHRFLPR